MNVLTTLGYKSVEDIELNDNLIAYDIITGNEIINQLISKEKLLINDSHFYKINNKWILYSFESIWANNRVVHVKDLQIGDTIYGDIKNEIKIIDIQILNKKEWWKLKVSGNHSYIANELLLHNPSRYWVAGNLSINWNATGPTNWGSATGLYDDATIPTASDDVIFDGNGIKAQSNSNISTATTIASLLITPGYTGILSHSADLTINGNLTFGNNQKSHASSSSTAIIFPSSSILASNGIVFSGSIIFTGSLSPIVKTISGSDFRISGSVTNRTSTANATILTSSNNEKLICNGFSMATSPNSPLNPNSSTEVVVTGGSCTGGPFYGSLTLSGSVNFNANVWGSGTGVAIGAAIDRTFTVVSGSNITWPATLFLGRSANTCSLDINVPIISSLVWIAANGANTFMYNLKSPLTCSNDFRTDQSNITWSGSYGFLFGSFTSYLATSVRLTPGNTYRILNRIVNFNSIDNRIHFQSTSTSSLATLILDPTASNNAITADFTRIDASGGRIINTYGGTIVSSSSNIRSYSDIPTVAFSSVG